MKSRAVVARESDPGGWREKKIALQHAGALLSLNSQLLPTDQCTFADWSVLDERIGDLAPIEMYHRRQVRFRGVIRLLKTNPKKASNAYF